MIEPVGTGRVFHSYFLITFREVLSALFEFHNETHKTHGASLRTLCTTWHVDIDRHSLVHLLLNGFLYYAGCLGYILVSSFICAAVTKYSLSPYLAWLDFYFIFRSKLSPVLRAVSHQSMCFNIDISKLYASLALYWSSY